MSDITQIPGTVNLSHDQTVGVIPLSQDLTKLPADAVIVTSERRSPPPTILAVAAILGELGGPVLGRKYPRRSEPMSIMHRELRNDNDRAFYNRVAKRRRKKELAKQHKRKHK